MTEDDWTEAEAVAREILSEWREAAAASRLDSLARYVTSRVIGIDELRPEDAGVLGLAELTDDIRAAIRAGAAHGVAVALITAGAAWSEGLPGIRADLLALHGQG